MDRIIREEARLIILKALAAEVNNRLNSELVRLSLESFGISRTRDWVHAELGFLSDIGALTVSDIGTVKIAALTQRGLDHVMRLTVLDGVKRPSIVGV
ncbi:hypothetical protein NKH89_10065 [Mesorhizobium sp. M0923]